MKLHRPDMGTGRRPLQRKALIGAVAGMLCSLGACMSGGRGPAPAPLVSDTSRYDLLETGFGVRSSWRRGDSLTVLLNALSRLYLPRAGQGGRDLYLDGSAFLAFSGAAGDPWTLHTGMLELRFTQAAFRIQAHRERAGQMLELLRGRLLVRKAYASDYPDPDTLYPGDMLMINRDIDLMEKERFDSATLKTWISGELWIDSMPLRQAMRQVSDWYDLDIPLLLDDTVRVSGRFRDASLDTVLQVLGRQAGFHVHREGRQIRLEP